MRSMVCRTHPWLLVLVALIAAPTVVEAAEGPPAAQWIWPTVRRGPGQVATFRHAFSPGRPVVAAWLRALADFNRLTVYLNERRVADVAPYSPPAEIDVREWLVPGENLLAVQGVAVDGPAAVPSACFHWV